jgi:hypothetical protein
LSFALLTIAAESGSFATGAEPPNVLVAETVHEMAVDYPDCLHVAVDHGGSDEAEFPPFQTAAERVGLARRGGLWRMVFHRFCRGCPSMNRQQYASKLAYSS